jgi:hypothetical protein
VIRCGFNATGASLFSRCTLMCKVYVCDKDAAARVAEEAAGASAEWQKWYHTYARHRRWRRWRVLVRLARLCSSLSRLRRRDAQSDPGARLGLSILHGTRLPTIPLGQYRCHKGCEDGLRIDLQGRFTATSRGPDGCVKRPSPDPEVSSKSFTLYVEPWRPSSPSCLASPGYYSWRPTLLIKQPAHQGPPALAYRHLHLTEPQIARHGPSPAFCTPALRIIGASGRLLPSTLRQARKTGTAESNRRFDLA